MKSEAKPKEVEDSVSAEEVVVSTKSLNVPAAKAFFKKFSEALKKEKRGSLAACLADPLCAVEGQKLTLTIASKGIEQNIQEFANRIKRELGDDGYGEVELAYQINTSKVSEYKLFTPQQQFDAMIKKNPMLEEFKQRFQLTFDE